ncbi:hypothetical protein ASE63_11805 [Bosea sp. Root381]|uniref:peroxidase family protein n=1 Tax=Bosea sp. Root381 TaxID=1736524 RepID=UPI0006F72064|nr:peroxidase family protein [Bosea sp. Root381]KRD96101.1 hypothetical protein ASE63_11805 [Bosea sp. Root381]
MFKLVQHDLEFVLKQIKIGEAHANGALLTEIRVNPAGEIITDPTQYNAGVFIGDQSWARAIPDPKTPFGIRTVDGSYNNLVPGREFWGASGQPMPRMFEGGFINEGNDSWTVDFDGPMGPGEPVTLTDNYGGQGNVADRDPRLISNLIVDMSASNPAALIAALTYAGSENPQADLAALLALRITPAEATAAVTAAQTALATAEQALADAIDAYNTAPSATTINGIQDAAEDVTTAETALTAAEALVASPAGAFMAKAEELGLQFDSRGSLLIPNVAPDEGLSAPFNSWMTFFGQFFDHGLDLITKGGNGTIYMPLNNDDPLVKGADGVFGTADDLPAQLRFMALTRSTEFLQPDGTLTQQNVTTSWVDQNQTYTSNASHQVFLREYKADPVTGRPVATGSLLDGTGPAGQKNGLPTWADVKAQAKNVLGIELTDADVGHVPVLRTDPYGEFIRGPNGLPQILAGVAADGTPIYIEGSLTSPIKPSAIQLPVGTVLMGGNVIEAGETVSAVRTANAFLDDIANAAQQVNSRGQVLAADPDSAVGLSGPGFYDNELLDAHFITGDGRGNENIGLTAVHHIFHSEHNRQVEAQKLTILRSGDLAFINEWLSTDLTAINPAFAGMTALQQTAYAATLNWDGERLFQAGRFATEMQYQHLVFEEFARKIQPAIDPFVFNSVTDIDPSIFAEFANVVYRFGHSMLTDSMPRVFLDTNGNITSTDDQGLIATFLNPLAFDQNGTLTAEQAAGAIVRGMTVERGNEIDEFVTGALRNNLLGIPLDLAAINIARGRDTGMPSLNEARAQLYAATSSTFLKPYESWTEFAANLKNPMSVVNFIAAYGTHNSIEAETTIAGKRAAATALVLNQTVTVTIDGVARTFAPPTDRVAYLNSNGWTDTNGSTETGLNNIDLWIGGLAEKKMPFGGFLGSTFNAVFEAQLENLQDGDRFYYLTRTQGLNALNELEQNSFSKLIMANTDITQPGPDGIRGTADDIISRHIGVDAFANYDFVFEVDRTKQADYNGSTTPGVDPIGNDPVLEALGLGKVIRDDPNTPGADANYFRTFGGEHVVVGGTNGDDTIITDFGDDAIWGDAGNDRIESGAGVDLVNGGAGDDIITDSGDTGDFLKGEEGNDVIANSNGLDILMGGDGQDVIFVGVDDTEVFGGAGNDFILGGDGVDMLMGNEGDDWIEGGGGFDTTAGDNSELFFNSTILGHDVMFAGSEEHDFDAESGDDIMVQGESVMRNEGMLGFDWAIHKGNAEAADSDLLTPIFTTDAQDILRDRFDAVEALSGWDKNDKLSGDNRGDVTAAEVEANPALAGAENTMAGHELTHGGVDRINGLRALLAELARPTTAGAFEGGVAFRDGNILLGGAGNDTIEGRGGNDIIDGDAWLNVRISIRAVGSQTEIATIDSLKHTFQAGTGIPTTWVGKTLSELMIARVIVPLQLNIVREVLTDDGDGDTDTAVYWDALDAYSFASGEDSILVSHTGFDEANRPVGTNIVSDGTDMIRNIEKLHFADRGNNGPGTILNVIEGTAASETINGTVGADLIAGYRGNDTLNGAGGNDFLLGGEGADILNGGEGNDYLAGGKGEEGVTYADNFDTASSGNSTGTADWGPDWIESNDSGGVNAGQIRIDANNNNALQFVGGNGAAFNGAQIQRVVNLTGATAATLSYSAGSVSLEAGESVQVFFAANGADFVLLNTITGATANQIYTHQLAGTLGANGVIRFVVSALNEANDVVTIDNLSVEATIPGMNAGTDQLNGGNGNDTYSVAIGDGNAVIQESSGTDRIVVTAQALTSLNAFENGGGDLVLQLNGQQVTVTDHFSNGNEAVEAINLDNATYQGYAFADDYALSTDGGNTREAAVGINTLLAGSTGNNTLIGNTGDDLLFGHDGTDTLDGGLGADLMVGGAGNDTYTVDDAGDVVVEAAGGGTDTVQTTLAAYTLGAELENLTYTGAGTFAGTGNELANRIVGGAGVDTLSGLGGNDTYVVTAGDIIVEAAGGGTDTVESAASYTLGAELENLALTGTAVTGTGNGGDNLITGNAAANQLFGAGGNDTINGGDGADLIDGGIGNDTLHGGAGNDTDILIGGEGNDTIHLATIGGITNDGNDIVRYTAANFGNDAINGFDANATGGQDQIDLSALGITADNFATRVTISAAGNNTLVTVRDASLAVIGTITLNGVASQNVTAADFLLAAGAPAVTINGTNAAQTISGTGNAETINALGGNDTVNALGGNDIVNGGEGADTLNGGDGNDTLSGGAGIANGTYVDEFTTAAYNNNIGTLNFAGNWTETGDNGSATSGDILITGGRLTFAAGTDNNDRIERAINLTGATAPTLTFDYQSIGLDAGETVTVQALLGTTNTWQTLGTVLGGTATSNFSEALNPAHTAIRFVSQGGFETGESFHIDNLVVSLGPNSGIDVVNGDAGDDTIIWNANATGPTDGRDRVNGGTEGTAGDTFVINGNGEVEEFRIYTRAAAVAAGMTGLAANSEIVITRNGTNNASIIAELSEIEEIRINGIDPSGTGAAGGDMIQIIGDFSQTSLRPNTITIDGGSGDDTVDISSLNSAHRIVFRSNGGNDTIIGALRPQDVIELPDGASAADYQSTTDDDGVTTMTNGTHSVTFRAPDGAPQIGDGDDDEDDDDDHGHGHDDDDEDDDDDHGHGDDDDDDDDHGHDDDDDDHACGCDDDDDETGTPAPTPSGSGNLRVGTASADVLLGTSGDDNIIGLAGDDVLIGDGGDDAISAGDGADFIDAGAGHDVVNGGDGGDHIFAGGGNDLVFGDAGADRIFGEAGDDVINAGAGDDTVFGGAGHDLFIAQVGDGNDTYHGDDLGGGGGGDTLDLSAITANLTVDLGNGLLGRGSAVSSQSGNDTLWSIEHVATGSGDDVITASRAVNVMEGGAGEDIFRFPDIESADGDTILDFEAGDRLDLAGIDADAAVAGNQSFTLVAGPAFTASAQLMVSYETRDGADYTIVKGNVGGSAEEDFRIELKGSHNLTGTNFTL